MDGIASQLQFIECSDVVVLDAKCLPWLGGNTLLLVWRSEPLVWTVKGDAPRIGQAVHASRSPRDGSPEGRAFSLWSDCGANPYLSPLDHNSEYALRIQA